MSRQLFKQLTASFITGTLVLFTVSPAVLADSTSLFTSTDAAVKYLTAQQAPDGSIGKSGASDWAAIALAAAGVKNDQLNSYIANETAPITVTGIERKMIALAATGQATSGYNALLAQSYNKNYIGDPTLLNDDWFGIMAIIATKDVADYPIATAAVSYIIAHQDPSSGGFGYCADASSCGVDSNDTAAAVVALESAQKVGITNPNLGTSIAAAVAYLKTTKQLDGGFGYDTNSWTTASDSASTSWVLMAFSTVADSSLDATINDAQKSLIAQQDSATGSYGYQWDGYNADAATTANATLALLGTNWLLNPAPISRPAPVVTAPTPTPAPVTAPVQATAPAAPPKVVWKTVASTATPATEPTIVADAPVSQPATTDQAVKGATTSVPNTVTNSTAPVAQVLPKPVATHNSASQLIGYGLIIIAVVGWAGHFAYRRLSGSRRSGSQS